jgi:hypothetical protein
MPTTPPGTWFTSPPPYSRAWASSRSGTRPGPDFPDQTTADQFFDDAQFETYRQLGYTVGEAVLADEECRDILSKRVGFVPGCSAP